MQEFKELILTDEEFIAAIEKNGYRKANGKFVVIGQDGEVSSACAVGQALLNLGVSPIDIKASRWSLKVPNHNNNLWFGLLNCPLERDSMYNCGTFNNTQSLAMHLNDFHRTTMKSIPKLLRQALEAINAPAG